MGLVTMVCKECGSDNISCRAEVYWKESLQEWVISEVLDGTNYCYECEEQREFDAQPWDGG
jgi:hypothetical protein